MELNHGDDVSTRWLIGGGLEVGEKLQGSKTVRLITLVRVEGVGKVDPHGDPKWRRWRGQQRQ
jgi:hypothetical protein